MKRTDNTKAIALRLGGAPGITRRREMVVAGEGAPPYATKICQPRGAGGRALVGVMQGNSHRADRLQMPSHR